jgi:hypothetical protein
MAFISEPTGLGSDHPEEVFSTHQIFSLSEETEPGLIDVKNIFPPSAVMNGLS